MTDFKLPDPKKTSGKVLGIGLLAGVGLLVWKILLPFLLTVVWGTVNLIIGVVAAAILLYIITNPKFWKRLKIILDTFGEILFKGFVEMNPFTIMEMQLNQSEKEREELKVQAEKLKAQEDNLITGLKDEQRALELSNEKINILKANIRQNPGDENSGLELESATNDWTNSNDYIQKVTPVQQDISKLVAFVDKAYIKSGFALKDARNTLKQQRKTWEAVTAGSSAMKKALRAFTGDPEMNKAGTIALEALKKDISGKIGTIKNSIQLTSQIMNQRDLNDAAKVSLAVQKAEKLDIDKSLGVTPVGDLGRLNAPIPSANKYLKQLNQ